MLKQIFLLIIFATVLPEANAEGTCDVDVNCIVNSASNDTAYTGMTAPPASTNTSTTIGGSNEGAYTQAAAGRNQSMATMATALALGSSYLARCSPTNGTACMLAGAAFAAAGLAGQARNSATNVMRELGANDQMIAASENGMTSSSAAALDTQLNQMRSDLAKNGYTLDSLGNITLPNGSTVNGDLSAQSMAAAGMSGADINGVQSGLDQMKKELSDKVQKMGGDGSAGDLLGAGGGSTGYNRVSISSLSSDGSENTAPVEAERKGIDRDPSAWQGFYKQFGDSVIGVAHSDIFLMVEKRVERERQTMGH